ncbi:putative choline transporter, neither null mutation nor overexpression affects choline transport [Irineochytrium annulatum]|nr:putative choline transporter, neither null mutation nor overexpression affects choline transport [Irineochytrium annulatum]
MDLEHPWTNGDEAADLGAAPPYHADLSLNRADDDDGAGLLDYDEETETMRTGANPKWFQPTTVYQDKWFAILFFLHYIPTLLFSLYGFLNFSRFFKLLNDLSPNPREGRPPYYLVGLQLLPLGIDDDVDDGDDGGPRGPHWEIPFNSLIFIWVMSMLVGCGLTAGYVVCLRKKASMTIAASVLWTGGVLAVWALMALIWGRWAAVFLYGGLFAVFGIMVWRWSAEARTIPHLFQAAADVIRKEPGTIFAAVLCLTAMYSQSCLWWLSLMGATLTFVSVDKDGEPDVANGYGLTVAYLLFSHLWASSVIAAVNQMTVAGVTARDNLLGGATAVPALSTRGAVTASARRATTTSFGSVCLGSLLICLLSWIKPLARPKPEHPQPVATGLRGKCAVACAPLGDALRWLAQLLSEFAFAYMAIYGSPYCASAAATHRLMREKGMGDVAQRGAFNIVVIGACGLIGGLGGFFGYVTVKLFGGLLGLPSDGYFVWTCMVLFVIMALPSVVVVGAVLRAAVVCTYVCLAEDPAAVKRTRPELFEALERTYRFRGAEEPTGEEIDF